MVAWVVLALPSLLLSANILPSQPQQLPKKEDGFSFTNEAARKLPVMPPNQDIRLFVPHNTSTSKYFLVDGDQTPFIIYVTPCTGHIEWTLYHLRKPKPWADNKNDGSLLDSASESLLRQSPTSRRKARRKNLRNRRRGRKRSGRRIVRDTIWSVQADFRQKFEALSMASGAYALTIKSVDANTSVFVYFTTSEYLQRPYPMLPVNPRVRVDHVEEDSVNISWPRSLDDKYERLRVEYCVAVNVVRRLPTQCAAMSALHGDSENWDWTYNKGSSSLEKQPASQRRMRTATHYMGGTRQRKTLNHKVIPKQHIFYQCVGSQTNFTFNRAAPNTLYNFDVYIVEKTTGRSSAYLGSSAVTPQQGKGVLRDAEIQYGRLDRETRKVSYYFYVKQPVSKLLFVLISCDGPVRVEIRYQGTRLDRKHGQKVIRKKVHRYIYEVLNNPEKGRYSIKVMYKRRRTRTFRLMASTRISKVPFPVLPPAAGLNEMETLRRCNEVHLDWPVTETRQRYCLYQEELPAAAFHQLKMPRWTSPAPRHTCINPGADPPGKLVSCYAYKPKKKAMIKMAKIINQLTPATRYRFDLYVAKMGEKQLILYDSIVISTPAHC